MFIILKTEYFQLWFLHKIDLHTFTAGKNQPIENDNIIHITYQISFIGYRCESGIAIFLRHGGSFEIKELLTSDYG